MRASVPDVDAGTSSRAAPPPAPRFAQAHDRAAQPVHGEQHLLRRLFDHALVRRGERGQLLSRGGRHLFRELFRRLRRAGGADDEDAERLRRRAGQPRRRHHVRRGARDPRLQVGAVRAGVRGHPHRGGLCRLRRHSSRALQRPGAYRAGGTALLHRSADPARRRHAGVPGHRLAAPAGAERRIRTVAHRRPRAGPRIPDGVDHSLPHVQGRGSQPADAAHLRAGDRARRRRRISRAAVARAPRLFLRIHLAGPGRGAVLRTSPPGRRTGARRGGRGERSGGRVRGAHPASGRR